MYRKEFFGEPRLDIEKPRVHVNRVLVWKSMAAAGTMIVLFFAGCRSPASRSWPARFLLVTRRVKPETVYREIDWSLLVLFVGLFVVVAGRGEDRPRGRGVRPRGALRLDRTGVLTALTAVLSNLVSNVPAVLVFKPLVPHLPDPRHAWLTLAMSSTLAGNLTVLGSVANLIVVERSRRTVRISFFEYLKVGIPLTVLSLLFGAYYLGRG